MKNYKEIAESVFERKEQYENGKKQKRKLLICTVTPICCVCLAVLIGFGAWQGGMFKKKPIQTAEDSIIPGTKDWYGPGESEPNFSVDQTQANDGKQDDTNNSIDYNSVIWGEQTKGETSNVNNGFKIRAGKMASYILIEAMDNAKSTDIFAVSVGKKEINTFKYNGKTLYEYENEISGDTLYKKKLTLLLKEGESLKYGEVLYTTGLPTGEKWSETLYKDRIDFYGKEFLSKFIVNGEFLVEEVKKEIAAYNDVNTQKTTLGEYKKVKTVYREQVLKKILEELSKHKINCQYSADNLSIIIFVTAEQFDNLKINDMDDFLFGLATKNGEVVTDTNKSK